MSLDELSEDKKDERQFYVDLVYRFWVLFDDKLRAIKGVEVDIDLSDVKPTRFPPYKLSPVKVAAMKELVAEFIADGIVEPVTSEWAFPALLVAKPKGGWRLVIDLRKLNEHIPHDCYRPPDCDLCLEWLQGRPYRTTADCRWGFHQVKFTDRAMKVVTFVTPFGTFGYRRLVMGYINSAAEFQRHINNTLGGLLWKSSLSMVDDLLTASTTLAEHRQDVTEVWTRLACRGHSLKPSKTSILKDDVEYLGHISTPEGLKPTNKHVRAIVDMPAPVDASGRVDKTRLRSFLGMVKYSRRYIKMCAKVCEPLNALLTEASDGVWREEHQRAADYLKKCIAETKGVWHINYNHPIYVCSDGSKQGIGGYLFQTIKGEERVIAYFSRATRPDEKKWDTREIEILAMIATLEHFSSYIDGQHVHLQTDHKNITWLHNLKQPSGRLGRWVMRLAEFNATIKYKKGLYMYIADCMSRNSIAFDEGRARHDEPGGIWMGEAEGKYALFCEEIFAVNVQGYEVGENTRMFKAELSEVCDTCVSGDIDTWAAEAELRAFRVSADTYADGQLEVEHEADVWGACDEAVCVKCSNETERSRKARVLTTRRKVEIKSKSAMPAGDEDAWEIPDALQATVISVGEYEKAQKRDEECSEIMHKLEMCSGDRVLHPNVDYSYAAKYQIHRGMLHRRTVTKVGDKEDVVLRVYVPAALRSRVMRNAHDTIWGVHRHESTTFKEVVATHFWPDMEKDVKEYVSLCEWCQLGKGTKPSRQGFLSGWRHNKVLNMIVWI